ncbi:hypothetical protein QDZ74_004354 [Pluralibacter gergoviae]|uniref:hypothetical protein n=2 Tax=Pluralibacter gergoviae TaxID=61647 RepID=UPI0006520129|nr:hypothetical protein [Pluralibacter gergoviae]EKW6620665.1 hypothetical protein [Pluralibacter gergoviae]KMK18535.1 hypothetical protein ABW09_08115 [Pluralibacter gergoviae]MCK1069227.1 hypothetical protein [Pluralibacter gergoviae]MCV7759470.1 hypothetical protein [Pluralibacter gergoviae]OHY64389.1 hypothetical protein BB778_20390 [Pluralibacter gergoviae]
MKQLRASMARMKRFEMQLRQGNAPGVDPMTHALSPAIRHQLLFSWPLVVSMFCALISFTHPLFFIWRGIFTLAEWPEYAVMAGVVPSILLFCPLLYAPVIMLGRGYSRALTGYLILVCGLAALSSGYIVFALTQAFGGTENRLYYLITALINAGLSIISIALLNTRWFAQAVDDFLCLRAWRISWKLKHELVQKRLK